MDDKEVEEYVGKTILVVCYLTYLKEKGKVVIFRNENQSLSPREMHNVIKALAKNCHKSTEIEIKWQQSIDYVFDMAENDKEYQERREHESD